MENNIYTSNKDTLGLKSIIVNYVRQWKVFLYVFILSFIPAILYLVLIPRTYEIIARVQVQQNEGGKSSFGLGEAAGLMKSFGLGGGGGGSIVMDDEIAILTSNNLIKQAVNTLGMNVQYFNPDAYNYKMYTNSPLLLTYDSITADNIIDNITLKVSIAADGKTQVKVKSAEGNKKYAFEFASLPAIIKLDQGDFRLEYRNVSQAIKNYKMKITVRPAYWVAENIAEEILVEEVSKSANTIELIMQDYERRRAVDFLNTLIGLYNDQDEMLRRQEAEKSMLFVDSRMQKVMLDLNKVENVIEQFKLQNNMTDIEYDVQLYINQMKDIQMKLIELEMQSLVINAMDEFVKDPDNEYNLVPALFSATDGENAGAISAYNTKLLERSQIIKTTRGNHPLISQVEDQVMQLREGVKLTMSNARENLKATITDLKGKEALIVHKMGEIPTLEREYIDYRRQQEIYQGVYLLLLQKREDIALTIGELKDRSRIIDAAYVKEKPVAPRKLYAALAMMLMTLFLPIAWIEGKKLFVEFMVEFKSATKKSK